MRMEGRKDFPYVVALSCSCGLTVVVRRMAIFVVGVMPASVARGVALDTES